MAFRFYLEAFKVIDKYKFWKYLIVPAICSGIIFAFTIWFAWKTSDELLSFAIVKFKLGEDFTYINTFLEFIVIVFIRGLVFFLYLKIYRYLLLFLLAPEFSFLTDVLHKTVTNEKHGFKFKKYFSDVFRGVKIALRNFLLEIFFTFLIIVLAIIVTWTIPLLPFLIMVIESYFFGFAMADYRNEFFNIKEKESRQLIDSHKGLVIGNGIFFNVALLIPVLGVFFAPVFALVAMGLSLNHVEQQEEYFVQPIHQSL